MLNYSESRAITELVAYDFHSRTNPDSYGQMRFVRLTECPDTPGHPDIRILVYGVPVSGTGTVGQIPG